MILHINSIYFSFKKIGLQVYIWIYVEIAQLDGRSRAENSNSNMNSVQDFALDLKYNIFVKNIWEIFMF